MPTTRLDARRGENTTQARLSPLLRNYMTFAAVVGLLLPLACYALTGSSHALGHVSLLVVQILGERLSAALEFNAIAAYVGPVAMSAYRVRTSGNWFLAAGSHGLEAAVAAANVALWTFNLVVTLGWVNVRPLLLPKHDGRGQGGKRR